MPPSYTATFMIGIDFGASFTGVCYSLVTETAKNPIIIPIITWPHAETVVYQKTPTMSVYTKKNDSYNLLQWGQKAQSSIIESDEVRVSAFKLLFDSESKAEFELANELPLEKIVSDYLKSVVTYVKEKIRTDHPHLKISKDSFRYCLTVPSTWDYARSRFLRRAAATAELIIETDPRENLIFLGKSKAAALDYESNVAECSLNDGDVILVCDAGGSTINLASYKVHYEEDGKYFEELTRAQDKSCGSRYIDDLFRLWIKGHLEKILGIASIENTELDEMTLVFSTQQKIVFEENEKNKDQNQNQNDDDDDDEENSIFIPLPASLAKRIDEGDDFKFIQDSKFKITPTEMKGFFLNPVVNEVLKLIDKQLQRLSGINPSKINISLVGGFGQSTYLYKRMRETFAESNRINSLFVPTDSGLSIARGAVLHGLDPAVFTQTYRENLNENDDSSTQSKSVNGNTLPGFEAIIRHFKKLGFKTDHYRESDQITPSEIIQKPKCTDTAKKDNKPAAVNRDSLSDLFLLDDLRSIYFDTNRNSQKLPEILPS